jgi:hypothetical protein
MACVTRSIPVCGAWTDKACGLVVYNVGILDVSGEDMDELVRPLTRTSVFDKEVSP